MDVGDHTTTGDGRLDEGVELLVTTDGELKVAGGDALHLLRSEREGARGGERAGGVVVAVELGEKFKRAAVDTFETRNAFPNGNFGEAAREGRANARRGGGRAR